jgi:hypothetical protein
MYSIGYFCQLFMKRKVSRQVFENHQMSDCVKIILVRVEMSYSDGLTDRQRQTAERTDRHDKDNTRFSKFCKGVW